MARLACVVVPGLPHHVTQRGNGRARTFFSDDDFRLYLSLLRENCEASKVACQAHVLMPNHVHLILLPETEDGLSKAHSLTHRSYAGLLNARRSRTGHFWQGRFGCVAMDGAHHMAALRYLLLNPVRARLVKRPEEWPWSSARALLKGKSDTLTDMAGLKEQFGDIRTRWGKCLISRCWNWHCGGRKASAGWNATLPAAQTSEARQETSHERTK